MMERRFCSSSSSSYLTAHWRIIIMPLLILSMVSLILIFGFAIVQPSLLPSGWDSAQITIAAPLTIWTLTTTSTASKPNGSRNITTTTVFELSSSPEDPPPSWNGVSSKSGIVNDNDTSEAPASSSLSSLSSSSSP